MADQKYVFVVGGWEDKFIADRIYATEATAIQYCDSRANKELDWAVFKVPIGGDWIYWDEIYRSKTKCPEFKFGTGGQETYNPKKQQQKGYL